MQQHVYATNVEHGAVKISEYVVGGLGPQLPYYPMRGVDYGFVQALKQLNADPFAEQIVGGLGPQPSNAVT